MGELSQENGPDPIEVGRLEESLTRSGQADGLDDFRQELQIDGIVLCRRRNDEEA